MIRIVSSLFALCSLTAAAQGTPVPADAIEKVRLADDIWLLRAPETLDIWTQSNAVVIVNENDVTVFDNSARATTSRMFIAEIRKITTKPVRTLINSHWHMDHWMGNEEFTKAWPGVQIIATAETRDYMKRIPLAFFRRTQTIARLRARLDSAIASGKLSDGSPLTPDARRTMENDIRENTVLDQDLSQSKQVLPTLVFTDSMTFWSGTREFRLMSMIGDATGSTVLYLPRERMVMTGDVLARRPDGRGAQPWTTNSYKISPWLVSLKRLDALDAGIIVPGQGPALTDKEFLHLTIALYESLIRQVHAVLEKDVPSLAQLIAAIDLRSIRSQFTADDPTLNARFDEVVAGLIRKVAQEARDGITPP